MNKIYIGNLPFKMDANDLRTAFAQFGEITDLFLVKERETGRLKGFGFITFSDASSAQAALQMDGQPFGGRNLKVSLAQERTERGGDDRRGGGDSRRRG